MTYTLNLKAFIESIGDRDLEQNRAKNLCHLDRSLNLINFKLVKSPND